MSEGCYKDYTVDLEQGGTKSSIHGNSVSISEELQLQTAESLGAKGRSSVFNLSPPRGTLTVESYINGSLTDFLNLEGSNDNEVSLQAGPYKLPKTCWMTSMSVSITPGEPLSCSRSFSYIGAIEKSTAPDPVASKASVAIPQTISIEGYEQISGSNNITSASWSLSQSYEEVTLLGDPEPIIVFSQGEITLELEGEQLTIELTEGEDDSCVVAPKDYSIEIIGCATDEYPDGENLGTLEAYGYMQSRGTSISTDSPVTTSVSLIQYL